MKKQNLVIGQSYLVTTYNKVGGGIKNRHESIYLGFEPKTLTSNEVHKFNGKDGVYLVLKSELKDRVTETTYENLVINPAGPKDAKVILKHTAGEWSVSTHEDNNDTVIRDSAGAILANLTCDTTRDYGMEIEEHEQIIEANAKLIAAAPDLLEALKGLIEYCAIDARGEGNYYGKALEAIKKATT